MRPRMLLPALAATVLVACGDEALSAAEFRERANEVCVEAEGEIDALAEEFGPRLEAEDPAEQQAAIEEFTSESVTVTRDAVDDLRALEAPDDLADDVDAWLDSFESSVEELEQLDGEQLSELVTSGDDPFAESNQLATDLGLDECGDDTADDTTDDTTDDTATDDTTDDTTEDTATDDTTDDTSAGDVTSGAAMAVFGDIEGWTISEPPPGADADTLAQSFADQDVVESVAVQSMTPTDGSNDGAIVLAFGLSEGARPFADTFRQGVLSSFESQGAVIEPITLAGQEATFVDASQAQGFLGVFWLGPSAAIFALGPDQAGVQAAAEAIIAANS